jgi:hypothetical protein
MAGEPLAANVGGAGGQAAAVGAASPGDLTHSPTLTAQATRVGTLLGTAAYMSPEQARALPADPRTDVWAFGCCLYESLTGRRPFAGEDIPQTLAAVLKDTPDWSALPADLPRHLAVLLRRSLEKNRRARVQSMGDVRVELQESLAPPSGVAPASVVATDTLGERRSRWVRPSLWLAVAVAGAIAAFVAGLMVAPRGKLESAPSMPPTHIPVAVRDEGRIHYSFFGRPLAISPDGQRIAYAGIVEEEIGIWLLNLEDARGAIPVEGTRLRYGPFFSPDGESLGSVDVNGGVEVVSLSGGKPRSVWGGPSLGRTGPTWDDAWIYYVDDTGAIGRIAASGDGSPQV